MLVQALGYLLIGYSVIRYTWENTSFYKGAFKKKEPNKEVIISETTTTATTTKVAEEIKETIKEETPEYNTVEVVEETPEPTPTPNTNIIPNCTEAGKDDEGNNVCKVCASGYTLENNQCIKTSDN